MNIYVASSWRNTLQPSIVAALRSGGHEVYDFKNPSPGNTGFSWASIDPNWLSWTPAQYRAALQHPLAVEGYSLDIGALRACDACVLVLPSGRSASWEFGYAMGQGKRGLVAQFGATEPELMYREATITTNMDELLDALQISLLPNTCSQQAPAGWPSTRGRIIAAAPVLARALCRVEWPEGYCGECGMERCYGHAPDCPLDAALTTAGLTTAEDREEVRCG